MQHRWRAVLLELPVSVTLAWDSSAVQIDEYPEGQLDPVYSELQHRISQVTREFCQPSAAAAHHAMSSCCMCHGRVMADPVC